MRNLAGRSLRLNFVHYQPEGQPRPSRRGDVLNEDYVNEMEEVLRKRNATKEAVGRDVRYRTARAAYRPPVDVTTTATPGVYKYHAHRQRADFSDKVQTPPSACILGGSGVLLKKPTTRFRSRPARRSNVARAQTKT
jgi:hypothetical protein